MRALLLTIAICSCLAASAQRKNKVETETFFVFDTNGQPCKIDDAKYLGYFKKESDTEYIWKYYHFEGPMIAMFTFRDPEREHLHGNVIYYGNDGQMDSSGIVSEGLRHDWWYFYTDSMTIYKKQQYDHGVLLRIMDRQEIYEDSIRRENESKKELVSAAFKGGPSAWSRYIQNNLQFPERAVKLDKLGTVIVDFKVDTDGAVKRIQLAKSVEFSIDQEAIRLFSHSPKWIPARSDGERVPAYLRQPLTLKTR